MMKWGRKKPVSSSSSSSSSTGLSRALPVSWFSKFNTSSDSKPTTKDKKKKKDDEASKNMSAKSSTKSRNEIQENRSNKENAVVTRKKSDEKFEEIMSSVKKKVRDFQIETTRGRNFLDVKTMEKDNGTLMIMTPRIRDKQRCERRDQKLLDQKQKRLEQDAEVKAKKPVRKTDTVIKPAHQWKKLKETKLREVKTKADQQRKSQYIKRELNRLGAKENNTKVRVFSPRATEKCRVKAIEDLKKAAKVKAREDGGTESESFAVVKCSSDPQKDFRDSMIEMIMENGINHPEELKELLVCYLRLNTDEYHDMIIKVFLQLHNDLNFHYFGVE